MSCAGTTGQNATTAPSSLNETEVLAMIKLADHTHKSTRKKADLKQTWSRLQSALYASKPHPDLFWRVGRLAMQLSLIEEARGAEWATECIKAAKMVIQHQPNAVQGHLYAGICKSVLAKHQPSNSQELSKSAMQHARKAVELDRFYENGAPNRLLGALLIYAPPWPTSVGDLDEGLEILETLTKEFPQTPMNFFLLAEGYRKAELTVDALRQYKRVLSFPPKGTWRHEGPARRKQARQAVRNLKGKP